MIPVCVLKNGKYYQPRHVQWLAQQVSGLQCLSNVDVPGVPTHIVDIPWSSFWCKMVMWDPNGPLGDEDLLFFDLDTVVIGDIDWMMQERSFFTLRNWYFNDEINSAVMRIPREMKKAVWDRWQENPEREIYTFNTSNHIGDQGFLTYILGMDHGFWQDAYTGRVVSYKQDIAAKGMPGFDANQANGNGTIPADTSVVCFYGELKPWDADLPWIPKLPTDRRRKRVEKYHTLCKSRSRASAMCSSGSR